jgi:hypothetical protein
VPGAFEIPLIAAKLAHCEAHRPDAIICLGVIIQGATAHADHIGEAITMALTQIQLEFHVPVIHEVLLADREADAKKRCLDPKFNKPGRIRGNELGERRGRGRPGILARQSESERNRPTVDVWSGENRCGFTTSHGSGWKPDLLSTAWFRLKRVEPSGSAWRRVQPLAGLCGR